MLINDNETLNKLMERVIANNSAIKKLDDIKINDYYNCYCFVAKVFGWVNELVWLSAHIMNTFLTTNTYEIDKPEIGDIMVWRDRFNSLEHTALIIGDNLNILQKPGSCHLEAGELYNNGLINDYKKYGYKITYRRVLL